MDHAQNWKIDATEAAAAGQVDEAERILRTVLEQDAQALEPQTMLCQLYLNAGRYQDALNTLMPVMDRINTGEAYLLASRLLIQTGKAKPAIMACAKGIELEPANPDLIIHLAEVYRALNQHAALEKLTIHAQQHLSGDDLRAYEHTLAPLESDS